MLKNLKIWFYKRSMRKAYLHYCCVMDDLDCGMHLAEAVRGPVIANARKRVNACADKLIALGETCPKLA